MSSLRSWQSSWLWNEHEPMCRGALSWPRRVFPAAAAAPAGVALGRVFPADDEIFAAFELTAPTPFAP
jgi:hypothetical protein